MRKSPYFLFVALCALYIQRVLTQCCLKFENQACIACPDGMHLYRNNCIYNLAHCAQYDNGFDCASCDLGFRLTQSKCEPIDYSDFINGSAPITGWKEFSDEQYFQPDLTELILKSQQFVFQKATGVNLEFAFSNSQNNLTYIRLVFTIAEGFLEHIYLKTNPVEKSILISSRYTLKKPEDKFIDTSADPNLDVCKQYLSQTSENLMLQDSRIIAAFVEEEAKNITFYRIFYLDPNHGLREFRVKLEEALDYVKGRKKEVLIMNQLPFTARTTLLNYLDNSYLQYVSPEQLRTAVKYTFINDPTKIQYILTFYHSETSANQTDQPAISFIDFTVTNLNFVEIQNEYLYKKEHPLSPGMQGPPIPKLDVSCSRKSSIRVLENTTSIVFQAYTQFPYKQALKRVIAKVARCLINPINQTFIQLEYLGTSNDTTDIFKVACIILQGNYTFLTLTVSIDKKLNEITVIQLFSVPSQNYIVQSFYVQNNTKIQQLLLDPSIYKIYEEHQFEQSEIISVCRFVEFKKLRFSIEGDNITQYVFKYSIKKPIIKKVYINYKMAIEANTKLTTINKDLNQYEYIEFAYRVTNDDYKNVIMLPISLYPIEQWRNASAYQLSEISLFTDKEIVREPLYRNPRLVYGLVSLNSFRRRIYINVEDQYILTKQLVFQVDFFDAFPPKLLNKTTLRRQSQPNCSPYPECNQSTITSGMVSQSQIDEHQLLRGLIQFNKIQFSPEIEDKEFIYLKKLDINQSKEVGLELMYANTTTLDGFRSEFRIGSQLIAVKIVDQNASQVGKDLLYICYKFYNSSEKPPQSMLQLAKTNLQTKVRTFQSISNKSIESPQLQITVAMPNLTIIDTKLYRNYTFNTPSSTIPLLTVIGQDRQNRFDDYIKIRNLLEEILGIDRIGKIYNQTREVLYDFNVVRRVSYLGAYDQILVSFERGTVQRYSATQTITKTSTDAEYFTFQMATPLRAGQPLIPRIFLSGSPQMMIQVLVKQNKLTEPESESEAVVKFIEKMYGNAEIYRQRNLINTTVWLIFIRHPKFGRMNVLADVVDEVVYEIDFQMLGMAKIVNSGQYTNGLVQENLTILEKRVAAELQRIIDITEIYERKLNQSQRRLKLQQWRSITYNNTKRVTFTYQNLIYVFEAEVLYNTTDPEANTRNINLVTLRAKQNNIEALREPIKAYAATQIDNIVKTEDWQEAERLFKSTHGYYVSGGKIVDIQKKLAKNRKYYTVRYQINQYILEVQLLYSPLQKQVTILSIIPANLLTPLILPLNCETSTKIGECSKCKPNYYLHADSNCYPSISHCEVQSGSICIKCTVGYIEFERDKCF